VRRAARRALAALVLVGTGLGAAGLAALGAVAAQAQAPEPSAAPDTPGAPASVLAPVVAEVIKAQGGPTWQPLPEVAAQARAAVAGLTADPMDAVAHGDPSMGCFVLVLRLGSGGVALHRALHDAFAAKAVPDTVPDTVSEAVPDTKPRTDTAPWTASDWTMAGDGAVVRSSFAFAGEARQGEVRVMSRGRQQQRTSAPAGAPAGDSMLVACFHDGREPTRSARLCKRMLPAIEDALQTIPETFP
jgi:hypothetical protein